MSDSKVTVKNKYIRMSDGYTRLYLSNQRIVAEHRHVVEEHLGRKLRSSEVVHHKDGDRSNNHLDNLEVLTKKAHNSVHASGRPMVTLECPVCKKKFNREQSKVKSRRNGGQKSFFCSRSCIGKATSSKRRDNTPLHGTESSYRRGCRCADCRKAKSSSYRKRKYGLTD